MAMTIFFALNGTGVAFLLYVLANFWNEGHGPKSNARKYAMNPRRQDLAEGIVLAHPISHAAQAGISVIPFPPRGRESNDRPGHGAALRGTYVGAARRISTRSMEGRVRQRDYDGLKEGRRC